MKDRERKQAERLVGSIQSAMARMWAEVARPLAQLERLLSRAKRDQQRFADLQKLQEMDCWQGDYMHRPNGKRPLPGRYRYINDSAPCTHRDHDAIRHRTHKEKNDLRQGRQNQGRN